MQILVDLEKDFEEIIRKYLTEQKFTNIPTQSEDLFIAYFNAWHRSISIKPRLVKKSDIFDCPPDQQAGLTILESRIRDGKNINSFQSRSFSNVTYDDPLLNDWGVHHLHLGETLDDDGYRKRTGPLLYAVFTPTDALFINILPHGQWTDIQLLEVIDRNWPEVLGRWQISGIQLSETFSGEQMKQLRKAGGVFFTEVNGKIFCPAGGGYATSGKSVRAVRWADQCRETLSRYEEFTKENAKMFEKEIKRVYGVDIPYLEFQTLYENNTIYVKDKRFNLRFKLGRLL